MRGLVSGSQKRHTLDMGIVDNVKEIADLIKKAGDIELYRKIVELEGEVIELTREKRRLEERLAEAEKKLTLKKEMVFKKPFYRQEGDQTPFCPNCFETKNLAVHLFLAFMHPERLRWDCKTCENYFLLDRDNRF